jgi:hypothetical protein
METYLISAFKDHAVGSFTHNALNGVLVHETPKGRTNDLFAAASREIETRNSSRKYLETVAHKTTGEQGLSQSMKRRSSRLLGNNHKRYVCVH